MVQERPIPKGRDGIRYLEVKFSSLSWTAQEKAPYLTVLAGGEGEVLAHHGCKGTAFNPLGAPQVGTQGCWVSATLH